MGSTRLWPVGIAAAGLAAITIIAGAGASSASSLDAGTDGFTFKPIEKCFMSKINMKRKAHGHRPLQRDGQLGVVARQHAKEIARDRALRHDSNYGREITNWKRLGQNTGRGTDCKSLFAAFWRSEVHRHNVLGRWRYVGVGVEQAGRRIYVQQVFESKRNPGTIYN